MGYNQRYPKIRSALTTGPSGAMLDGVLEGKLNAAFIGWPATHPGWKVYRLTVEEMMTSCHTAIRFMGQRGEWL